jgi:hypothetical protein
LEHIEDSRSTNADRIMRLAPILGTPVVILNEFKISLDRKGSID